MCEMNDFHFRIALTRTHAGFLVFTQKTFSLSRFVAAKEEETMGWDGGGPTSF